MDIDEPGVGGMTVAPHLLEELLAREHLPRRARQGHQQIEFEGGQRDDTPLTLDDVTGNVDRQILEGKALIRLRILTAAQARPHTGHQFFGLEGLGHIIVGAGLESRHNIRGIGTGGQHNDRRIRDPTDRTTHVKSIHAGQHDVQENQVRVVFLKLRQRGRSVGTEDDLKALVLEDNADHLSQGDVVVDDEDARTHITIVSRNRHERRRLAQPSFNFSPR